MMIAQNSLAAAAQESPTGGSSSGSGVEAAAVRVVAHLPQDQALGLRLLMLARTAAAVHMAETTGRLREARGGAA